MGLFETLSFAGRRVKPPADAPPNGSPSEAETRATALAEWITKEPCGTVFVPYLDKLITAADAAEGENLASHTGMAYCRGRRDALRDLKNDIASWRDKA